MGGLYLKTHDWFSLGGRDDLDVTESFLDRAPVLADVAHLQPVTGEEALDRPLAEQSDRSGL